MKHLAEMLLRENEFSEIVMGNTAVVRAMVEAGTRVVSSYPGSPTPEIAVAIKAIPRDKRPFYFEFSTNEKVATEVAYGAAVNGHLSTVFFKSVGLNVASDTFVQLAHMNIIGGMVIVIGDDPGVNSSQNEQDNRHYALMSYTPVFEPASPSEVYTYYKEAARLSCDKKMPVILRMTTHVCHAKEKVHFSKWSPTAPDDNPKFDPANGPYIPIAASLVLPMKRKALLRLEEVRLWSESSPLNRLVDNKNSDMGIITSGLSFMSAMDLLERAKKRPDILKLGIVYPLARKTVADFLRNHRQVKVVEELDDIAEKEIKSIAFEEKIDVKIFGKSDSEDWVGEYTPDKVYEVLRKTWPDLLPEKKRSEPVYSAPLRQPQMCPGCGHRSAFYAIKKALAVTDITVADIGCHTLGFLPPYEVGQLLMCMGASTGMGSGLSLFNQSRKVVAFLGDSTFFHAGLPGIINAVFNRHPVTLIVMENGTTAMTGHQDHAASGRNFNEITDKIPVRHVLEGLGVKHIFETDTYMQSRLTELVREAVAINEFSVVIAKHPCMLKLTREQRRRGSYTLRHVEINPDRCERIYECVEKFGCPTFTRRSDGSIETNLDLCIGDGSCIQTCSKKAIQPSVKE